MAKRGYLETMIWETFRGTGRQTGRGISKLFQREVANRVYDPNSKFRKKMQNFTITSTLKGSLKKMYEIIDLFYEEYKIEKTLLQKSMYIDSDIRRIERKLHHIKSLVRTEDDGFELEECNIFWNQIKSEISK